MMRRASLLVVDDNEANRDALSRRLGSRGYDVTVAAGGELPLASLVSSAARYVNSTGVSIIPPQGDPVPDPTVLAALGLSAELRHLVLAEFEAEFAAMKPFYS